MKWNAQRYRLPGMNTSNYRQALDRVAAARVAQDSLNDAHLGPSNEVSRAAIARAHQSLNVALKLADVYATLAVADELADLTVAPLAQDAEQ